MADKLYVFRWNAGRMGKLEGLFVADEHAIAQAIGKEVYFGEVLGKHSEIAGTLEATNIRVVSDDPELILRLRNAFHGASVLIGYNPLDYLREEEEDDAC